MVSGRLGAFMVHAARHVEEGLNAEAESATTQLQQTAVEPVQDQINNHEAAIHNLVKVT